MEVNEVVWVSWASKFWEQLNIPMPNSEPQNPGAYRFQIKEKLRMGQSDEALALMVEANRKFPDDLDFCEQLWDQAVRMGRAAELTAVGQDLIEWNIRNQSFDLAYYHWKELVKFTNELPLSFEFIKALCFGLLQLDRLQHAQDVFASMLDVLDPAMPSDTQFDVISTASHLSPQLCKRSIELFLARGRVSTRNGKVMQSMLEALEKQNPNLEAEVPGMVQAIELSKPDRVLDSEPVFLDNFNPFTPTRVVRLKRMPFKALAFDQGKLLIDGEAGKGKVALNAIFRLSAAIIRELSLPPYVMIDLFVDDPMKVNRQHRVVRLAFLLGDNDIEDPYCTMKWSESREIGEALLNRGDVPRLPEDLPFHLEALSGFASVPDFENETYGVF